MFYNCTSFHLKSLAEGHNETSLRVKRTQHTQFKPNIAKRYESSRRLPLKIKSKACER
jgi:hypothetical protein